MAEAMDLDRYVRTGIGDPRRLVRTLGSERLASSEMLGLIAAIRAWNQAHGADRRIGFYGFEIPSGAHAVATLLALPDSVTGVPLKAWMRQQLTRASPTTKPRTSDSRGVRRTAPSGISAAPWCDTWRTASPRCARA